MCCTVLCCALLCWIGGNLPRGILHRGSTIWGADPAENNMGRASMRPLGGGPVKGDMVGQVKGDFGRASKENSPQNIGFRVSAWSCEEPETITNSNKASVQKAPTRSNTPPGPSRQTPSRQPPSRQLSAKLEAQLNPTLGPN